MDTTQHEWRYATASTGNEHTDESSNRLIRTASKSTPPVSSIQQHDECYTAGKYLGGIGSQFATAIPRDTYIDIPPESYSTQPTDSELPFVNPQGEVTRATVLYPVCPPPPPPPKAIGQSASTSDGRYNHSVTSEYLSDVMTTSTRLATQGDAAIKYEYHDHGVTSSDEEWGLENSMDCPHCGTYYVQYYFELERHIKAHYLKGEGDKFVCPADRCDRTFLRADARSKHMWSRHDWRVTSTKRQETYEKKWRDELGVVTR